MIPVPLNIEYFRLKIEYLWYSVYLLIINFCIRGVSLRIGRISVSEGLVGRCKVKIYPAKVLTDSGNGFWAGINPAATKRHVSFFTADN
ncbi:hypothetical protein D1BOALGB6SA_5241 [Olavius sp. associated proteobacterium Delta 1]|nr:hypothetical protein D1BOALGB6SA_5241 [Olavius sp. associated proteobacterium Delta 1]